MKKTVVMWLKDMNDGKLPKFNGSKQEAYHTFFERASKKFNFYFAFDLDAYKGRGVFGKVAEYKNGEIVWSEESNVQSDIIYLFNDLIKDPGFDPSPAKIINPPSFRLLCGDKEKQSGFLSKFFPNTTHLSNKEEIKSYLNTKSSNEIVVLKPISGSSGQGVIVDQKQHINLNEIDTELLHQDGYIAQQFIDTSDGIPGIVDGTHDLRIITMNNTITLCHVRIPQDGSLIGNTHRGAEMKEVDYTKLPQNIRIFHNNIDNKLTKEFGPILYSMDIGVHTDGTPYLFELNGHTAFPRKDFEIFDKFINTLIEIFDNL